MSDINKIFEIMNLHSQQQRERILQEGTGYEFVSNQPSTFVVVDAENTGEPDMDIKEVYNIAQLEYAP